MEKTPLSLRKHVTIFGSVNAGKSSLFNALLGQDTAIVSEVSGTTTDPIVRSMELIPYGPIALIDTAGLDDISTLGEKREEKTKKVLNRTDLIVYVIDIGSNEKVNIIDKNIPYVTVYTKCDLVSEDLVKKVKKKYTDAIFMYSTDSDSIDKLRKKLIEELEKQESEDNTLIGDLLPKGSCVVMVVPIDSAAPKGRIILPQVQLIRDCLDHDMKAYVTKETTLKEALDDLKRVDLVVTDSQAFKMVDEIVPKDIPLTSFSMVLARQKGNFNQLIDGTEKIKDLKDRDKILVLEGCTHNTTHEDIGKHKIPKLLREKTGRELIFDYYTGYDFPSDLSSYSMVIQCGGCMINKREIKNRLIELNNSDIPVTNYGVILAYLNGILDRAGAIFRR